MKHTTTPKMVLALYDECYWDTAKDSDAITLTFEQFMNRLMKGGITTCKQTAQNKWALIHALGLGRPLSNNRYEFHIAAVREYLMANNERYAVEEPATEKNKNKNKNKIIFSEAVE